MRMARHLHKAEMIFTRTIRFFYGNFSECVVSVLYEYVVVSPL